MVATNNQKRSTHMDGVQTLTRAFSLLECIANASFEVTLSTLAAESQLPLPTVHRLMQALVRDGYARQTHTRKYALGPRLIALGEKARLQLGIDAEPFLAELVEEVQDTVNLTCMDGDSVLYLAQALSGRSMRMFTEVGRRVQPHSAASGKVLLSQLPHEVAEAVIQRTGMPAYTPQTITEFETLALQLKQVQSLGYAIDDEEHEVGVRCVAVPVPNAPTPTAISVSAPGGRLPQEVIDRIIPVMQHVASQLGAALSSRGTATDI